MPTALTRLQKRAAYEDALDSTALTDPNTLRRANPLNADSTSTSTPSFMLFSDSSALVPNLLPNKLGEMPNMTSQLVHLVTTIGDQQTPPHKNPVIIELMHLAREVRREISTPSYAARSAYNRQLDYSSRDPNANDRDDVYRPYSNRLEREGRNMRDLPEGATEHTELTLSVAQARLALNHAVATSPSVNAATTPEETKYRERFLADNITAHAIAVATDDTFNPANPQDRARLPGRSFDWTNGGESSDSRIRPSFEAAWKLPETTRLIETVHALHMAMSETARTYNTAHGLTAEPDSTRQDRPWPSKAENPNDHVDGTSIDRNDKQTSYVQVNALDPKSMTRQAIDSMPVTSFGERQTQTANLTFKYDIVGAREHQSDVLKAFVDAAIRLDDTPGAAASMTNKDWAKFARDTAAPFTEDRLYHRTVVNQTTQPTAAGERAIANTDAVFENSRTQQHASDGANARGHLIMTDLAQSLITFATGSAEPTPSALAASSNVAEKKFDRYLGVTVAGLHAAKGAQADVGATMARMQTTGDIARLGHEVLGILDVPATPFIRTADSTVGPERLDRQRAAGLITERTSGQDQSGTARAVDEAYHRATGLNRSEDPASARVLATAVAYAANDPASWSPADRRTMTTMLVGADYLPEWGAARRSEQRRLAESNPDRFLDNTASGSPLGSIAIRHLLTPMASHNADFERAVSEPMIRTLAGPENITDRQAARLNATFGGLNGTRAFGSELATALELPNGKLDRQGLSEILAKQVGIGPEGTPLQRPTEDQRRRFSELHDIMRESGLPKAPDNRHDMDLMVPALLTAHNANNLSRADNPLIVDTARRAITVAPVAESSRAAMQAAIDAAPDNLVSGQAGSRASNSHRDAAITQFATPGEAIAIGLLARHSQTSPAAAERLREMTTGSGPHAGLSDDAMASATIMSARYQALSDIGRRNIVRETMDVGFVRDDALAARLEGNGTKSSAPYKPYSNSIHSIGMRITTVRPSVLKNIDTLKGVDGIEGQFYFDNTGIMAQNLKDRTPSRGRVPLISFTPTETPFVSALVTAAGEAGYDVRHGYVDSAQTRHTIEGNKTHIEGNNETVSRGTTTTHETTLLYNEGGRTKIFDPEKPPALNRPTLFLFDVHGPDSSTKKINDMGVEMPSNREELNRLALAVHLTGRKTIYADESRAATDVIPLQISAGHNVNRPDWMTIGATPEIARLGMEKRMELGAMVPPPQIIDRTGKTMDRTRQTALEQSYGNRNNQALGTVARDLEKLPVNDPRTEALLTRILASGRAKGSEPSWVYDAATDTNQPSTPQHAASVILRGLEERHSNLGQFAISADDPKNRERSPLMAEFHHAMINLSSSEIRDIASATRQAEKRADIANAAGLEQDHETGRATAIRLPTNGEKLPSYSLVSDPTRSEATDRQVARLMDILTTKHGVDAHGVANFVLHVPLAEGAGAAAIGMAQEKSVPVIAHTTEPVSSLTKEGTTHPRAGLFSQARANAHAGLGGIDATSSDWSGSPFPPKPLQTYVNIDGTSTVSATNLLTEWHRDLPTISTARRTDDIAHMRGFTAGVAAYQQSVAKMAEKGDAALAKPTIANAVAGATGTEEVRERITAAWTRNATGFRKEATEAMGDNPKALAGNIAIALPGGRAAAPTVLTESNADQHAALKAAAAVSGSPVVTAGKGMDESGFAEGAAAAHRSATTGSEPLPVHLPQIRAASQQITAVASGIEFYRRSMQDSAAGASSPRLSFENEAERQLASMGNIDTRMSDKKVNKAQDRLISERAANETARALGARIIPSETLPRGMTDEETAGFMRGVNIAWKAHAEGTEPKMPATSVRPSRALSIVAALDRSPSVEAEASRRLTPFAAATYEAPPLDGGQRIEAHFTAYLKGFAERLTGVPAKKAPDGTERAAGLNAGRAAADLAIQTRPSAQTLTIGLMPNVAEAAPPGSPAERTMNRAIAAFERTVSNHKSRSTSRVFVKPTSTAYTYDSVRDIELARSSAKLSTAPSPGSLEHAETMMRTLADRATKLGMTPYLDLRTPENLEWRNAEQGVQTLASILAPAARRTGVRLIVENADAPSATAQSGNKPPLVVETIHTLDQPTQMGSRGTSARQAIAASDAIIAVNLDATSPMLAELASRGRLKPIAVLPTAEGDRPDLAHSSSTTSILGRAGTAITSIMSLDGSQNPRSVTDLAFHDPNATGPGHIVHAASNTGRGAVILDSVQAVENYADLAVRASKGLPTTTLDETHNRVVPSERSATSIAMIGGSTKPNAETARQIGEILDALQSTSPKDLHIHTTLQPGVNEAVIAQATLRDIPVTVHTTTPADQRTPGQAAIAESLGEGHSKAEIVQHAEADHKPVSTGAARAKDAVEAAHAAGGIVAIQIERNAPELLPIASAGRNIPVIVPPPVEGRIEHSAGSSLLVHPDQPIQAYILDDPALQPIVRTGRHAQTYPDTYAKAIGAKAEVETTGAGATPATTQNLRHFAAAADAAQTGASVYPLDGEHHEIRTMDPKDNQTPNRKAITMFGEHLGSHEDPALVRYQMLEETVLNRRLLMSDANGNPYVTGNEQTLAMRLSKDLDSVGRSHGPNVERLQDDAHLLDRAHSDEILQKNIAAVSRDQAAQKRRSQAQIGD